MVRITLSEVERKKHVDLEFPCLVAHENGAGGSIIVYACDINEGMTVFCENLPSHSVGDVREDWTFSDTKSDGWTYGDDVDDVVLHGTHPNSKNDIKFPCFASRHINKGRTKVTVWAVSAESGILVKVDGDTGRFKPGDVVHNLKLKNGTRAWTLEDSIVATLSNSLEDTAPANGGAEVVQPDELGEDVHTEITLDDDDEID